MLLKQKKNYRRNLWRFSGVKTTVFITTNIYIHILYVYIPVCTGCNNLPAVSMETHIIGGLPAVRLPAV